MYIALSKKLYLIDLYRRLAKVELLLRTRAMFERM